MTYGTDVTVRLVIFPTKKYTMKAIERLNNVEKAKLLFALFPDEIPVLIKFMKGMYLTIREDEQSQRQEWKNGIYTFDFWFGLVEDAENKINQYGTKLHGTNLFSVQLFDGYVAMYTVYCMNLYTTTRKPLNGKFTAAFNLLFND
jgi:hypothetical protein